MRPVEAYIVVIVVAIALLFFWRWGSRRSREREKKIAASRSADTLEAFVASFRPEVRLIASAMYTQFQEIAYSNQFPFRKSDPVAKILSIDKFDLDEALLKVANQFGCRKPTKEDDDKFRGRETFEDFVEFIYYLSSNKVPVSSDRPG